VRGFKYGDLQRAELNYSSNVKPRSENKTLAKNLIGKVGTMKADRSNAGASSGGQSGFGRPNFLFACYFG
jgi:hypothetical protein